MTRFCRNVISSQSEKALQFLTQNASFLLHRNVKTHRAVRFIGSKALEMNKCAPSAHGETV
jgi:hypothetical protein